MTRAPAAAVAAGTAAGPAPGTTSGARRVAAVAVAALIALGVAGCTVGGADPGVPTPGSTSAGSTATGSSSAAPSATASASASEIPEPTSTNTLPPPPAETGPAPSTAGRLTADALPVPAGWKTVVREGGSEEGYQGNGTWTHGRDPRYAAQDVIGIGCTAVSRDDYADPRAALEGTYEGPGEQPGVGLVLDFTSAARAQRFYDLYRGQVESCRGRTQPYRAEVLPVDGGLVDRRTYPDSEWTEVVAAHGTRVTLIILSDPGHRIEVAAAQRILDQIG